MLTMAGTVTKGTITFGKTWAGWEYTVVVTELVLLPRLVSCVSEDTVAVLVIMPGTVGAVIVTIIFWVRPDGKEAVVAVTTPLASVMFQPGLKALT